MDVDEGRNDLPCFGRSAEGHLYTAFEIALIRKIWIGKQQTPYQKKRGRHLRETIFIIGNLETDFFSES